MGMPLPPKKSEEMTELLKKSVQEEIAQQPEPPKIDDVVSFNHEYKLTEDEVEYILLKHLLSNQMRKRHILIYIGSYVASRNNSQASKDAGIPWQEGRALLNNPHVHGAIVALTAKQAQKYGFDGDDVIARVKEVAEADPAEVQNPDGSFKTRLTDIAPETRRAIKSFKVSNLWETDANGMKYIRGQVIDVQFWDKMKGLEMLGSEKQVMKKRSVVEHDVTKDMKSVLLGAAERAEQRAISQAREVMVIEGKVESE